MLREYIDEQKNMTSQMITSLSGRVNAKADFQFFEDFKSNVQDTILSKMEDKITIHEHKQAQRNIRKKLNKIEKNVDEIAEIAQGPENTY